MPEFQAPSNYTDPKKIEIAIAAKKLAWKEQAALSPVTGNIIAIGVLQGSNFGHLSGVPEKVILDQFWNLCLAQSGKLIGFNCLGFDLPFCIKRSWVVGSTPANNVGIWSGGRWKWSEHIIDLMLVWQMGNRQAEGGLDMVGRFLTGSGKTGQGKDFSELFKTDKNKALEYLKNDLELTQKIYTAMFQAKPEVCADEVTP